MPPRPNRVTPVALTELAAVADARLVPGAVDVNGVAVHDTTVVTGATLRAQYARPGDLFAALPGAKAHGADFAGAAVAAGAGAVLTDEAGAARPALRDAGRSQPCATRVMYGVVPVDTGML